MRSLEVGDVDVDGKRSWGKEKVLVTCATVTATLVSPECMRKTLCTSTPYMQLFFFSFSLLFRIG
jgi:hypothetical protein